MQITTVELFAEDEIRFFDPKQFKDITGNVFYKIIYTYTKKKINNYNRKPHIYICQKPQLGHILC